MPLMEFFGFASGISSHGPSSPFVQEGVLKDYSTELMENLSLTSVSPYDFISLDFSAIQQGLMNIYLSLVESTHSRSVGVGFLAVTAIYGAWKAIGVWNNSMHSTGWEPGYELEDYPVRKFRRDDGCKRKDYGDTASNKPVPIPSVERCTETDVPIASGRLSQSKGNGNDDLAAMSENFQRQLKDAMSRMDDVKFRLKELENDKALLTAEIDVRKQMIIKLQEENSKERERRQQAELKMEMMSFENSQIRQLRKEISVKSNQVEKLEKLIKDKDDLQMKMFEDNIVLPRNVVESRAKEFSELQNRVHQLQAETESAKRFRDFQLECQPCRLSKSIWLEGDSLPLPAPHLNENQVSSKKNYRNETSITLLESNNKQLINTKMKLADRSPNVPRQMAKSTEKMSNKRGTRMSPSLIVSNKVQPDVNYVFNMKDSKSVTHVNVASGKVEDLSNSSGSVHQTNLGVFAQIRSLVTASRGNSSYCDPANLALLKHIGALLNSARPKNNRIANGENPLSDEQSSVFMSASDGSDTDRNELRDTRIRKYQNKRATPLKRLSKYRRNRRRDGTVLKRRLAVKYSDGQAHLIGLGESPTAPPSGPEQSDSSIKNKNHYVANVESSNHNCAGYLQDNQVPIVSALTACDDKNAHGGESWILIIPKAS